MMNSRDELEKLKLARYDETEIRSPKMMSFRNRFMRYYRNAAAEYPPHVVWFRIIKRVLASLRARVRGLIKFNKNISQSEIKIKTNNNPDKEKLIRDLIDRVEKGLKDGCLVSPLIFSVCITGGIGDALICARLVRDLQAHLGNDMLFDVYFESPAVIEPFFRKILGFRNSLNVKLLNNTISQYDFSLTLNQYALFSNENIDYETLLSRKPEVLNVFSRVESLRIPIERYITKHPYLDGAFADVAVKKGYKRYTYLHEMLGVSYGGDLLDIEVDKDLLKKLNLTEKKYITIHDGWDANFALTSQRPTKAIPLAIWTSIVKKLKTERPDLIIVQLGGKTGDNIPGVDVSLKGALSFMQSAAVLANAAIHIDAESGLVHLGSALGVKSVVMFGPTNLAWFGYPQNANIPPLECGNCWWSTDTWMDTCPIGHAEPVCTNSINPETVVSAALKLINAKDDVAPMQVSIK